MVVTSTSRKPRAKWAAGSSYAAGATGILANLFLIAFYALQVGRPEYGLSFGTANDLVGSLSDAFMVPVALASFLPNQRLAWISRLLGLPAMVILVVGGPLLTLGVLSFEVQTPIAVSAAMVLLLWLFLINRWLRRLSGALR